MDNKVRFAIVGCGAIAESHATECARNGDLIGVCDVIEERAHRLANKFNCSAYLSLDELLAQQPAIDVVSICTPNYLHAPQSIQCLKYGANVLCEKPMAISTKSAQEMVYAASASGKKLFIVKQNRYNPLARYIKNLIEGGKLGKIFSFHANCFWNRSPEYYRDWRGKWETDGGTLYTQFSHYIDLITWFFGNPQRASLLAKNFNHPQIEFEDAGIVNFVMENGILGSMSYSVNAFEKNMESSVSVFAEKGTIKIGGQYLNSLDYFVVKDLKKPVIEIANGPNEYGNYKGSMSSHDKVYENLILALKNPLHKFLEGEEGIKTVELIEYLYSHRW